MLTSKFKEESSRKDQTCYEKDLYVTHRSDLSKKTYLPVLDRRTHPFAGSKQFPSGRHTYGTAGGQKSVHVGWESGIFLRCFHMKWCQAFWHIDLAFFFRITMTFLWMDASSSLHADDNAEPCTFWWLRSCLIFCCSSVQSSPIGQLYWIISRPRASVSRVIVGIFELEVLHIADALGMSSNNQQH